MRALNLRDAAGNTFADVAKANGMDPAGFGRDESTLGLIGDFIELHVEQGKGLNSEASPTRRAAVRRWQWATPSWATAAGS